MSLFAGSVRWVELAAGLWAWTCSGLAQPTLSGTQPLTLQGDLSAQMVAGIGRYFEARTNEVVAGREQFWRPDFSSRQAYEKSIAPNRARLARMIGVVDSRVAAPQLEFIAVGSPSLVVAETDRWTAFAVRWPVLDGVWGEGLLLRPKGRVVGRVVALPDADQSPEQITGLAPGVPAARQYARRLAENGCEVVIPTLVNRADTWSGNPALNRRTNQPHREWIYRQAFALGRHPIGFEVQKVLAVVDWFTGQGQAGPGAIGVVGWGEGALIALYSAALDARISVAAVSGYFGPREQLAQEPIYRNVFGLLKEFGDAELARLIVPRRLIVEYARTPEIDGPPAPRAGFAGAAPGRIVTPAAEDVRREVQRAQRLVGPYAPAIELTTGEGGDVAGFFADATLKRVMDALASGAKTPASEGGASSPPDSRRGADEARSAISGSRASRGTAPSEAGDSLLLNGPVPHDLRIGFDPVPRQRRAVDELSRFCQRLIPGANGVRENFLWKKVPVTTAAAWQETMRPYRSQFWDETIGRITPGTGALNPRSRPILDRPTWSGHEVVIDVLPEVFAWGYLLLPKGMQPGEKRPVVVAQHGLEGLPADVIEEDRQSRAYGTYKAFAARLVERGFIVFAPHNPYRGDFRELQRLAHPLGQSIFAIITAQHERLLDWLATLPNVDPARIGFYGLSYGGSTAMRVPALLERYAVTVCSGNFNEWVWKLVTTDWAGSYVFTKEYEMPEFNLGATFGHAEMAALIAPRPFMVERGHDDGVGIDEWVGFEYAKVNRLYDRLKIPERTRIEYFAGPHTIHGVGTFAFLHRHLNWPEPAGR